MNGTCSPATTASSATTLPSTASIGGGGTQTASAASSATQIPGAGGGGGGGRTRPDPPRRSRSQGTRKLHKCLSTASYSEDCATPPYSSSSSVASLTTGGGQAYCAASPAQRQQLMVARQYCSFGSTRHHSLYLTSTSYLSTLTYYSPLCRSLFSTAHISVSVSRRFVTYLN